MKKQFSISNSILQWCISMRPCSQGDQMVLQYGLELFLDDALKLLALILVGAIAGYLHETIIVLVTFCSLRSQAGGFHARTKWGCSICMTAMLIVSIVGSTITDIPLWIAMVFHFISLFIILVFVPRTINRSYFSEKAIHRKKVNALILISMFMIIAYLVEKWRDLMFFSIFLEIMSLIPSDNAKRGGVLDEERSS